MGGTLSATNGEVDVLIIGSGPTGIAAAHRLVQYGQESWLMVDAEKYAGGMASSIKTRQNFRFDTGYKRLYSRYEYVDKLLDKSFERSSKTLLNKTSKSCVYLGGSIIQYPVQNNLCGLPEQVKTQCVLDLVKSQLEHKSKKEMVSENLDEYLVQNWGEQLSNVFFRPYVFKSLAIPTAKLSASWARAKIPPSNLGSDIEALMNDEQRDPGWGVECKTYYPDKGGMAGMWKTVLRSIPKDNVRFRSEIVELNFEEKFVKTKDDVTLKYKTLISTMPLPTLLNMVDRTDLSDNLLNTTAYLLCLGIRGTPKTKFQDIDGCIYFPEADTIFHRVSIHSNYDEDSVPKDDDYLPTLRFVDDKLSVSGKSQTGPYWSVTIEVNGGPIKSIDENTIVDEVIQNCCAVGLVAPDDEIVALHFTEMTHGYPLPTLDSDEKINKALEWLSEQGIYSRGKFGGFKYYHGDLDQCIVQGVEVVDKIITERPERLIWQSGADVHGGKNDKIEEPKYEIEVLAQSSENYSDVVNAANVRGAITTEPLHSSNTSTSVSSPVSGLSPPSSDISDTD